MGSLRATIVSSSSRESSIPGIDSKWVEVMTTTPSLSARMKSALPAAVGMD